MTIGKRPFEADDKSAAPAWPDPDPPVDYQPECGQPGVREEVEPEERDEDDDL